MGGIRDKAMAWTRVQEFIPYWGAGLGPTIAVNEGGSTSHAAGAILPGADVGAPIQKEIGSSGINGLLLDTAGDMAAILWPMPRFDVRHDFGVRVVWASAAAAVGNRTITWIVTYSKLALQEALVTPATALDTTITAAAAPKGTANVYELSARGAIAANKFLSTLWGNGKLPLLNWRAEMDAFHADFTEDKWLLGLLVDYVPLLTRGTGAKVSRFYT